MTISDDHLLGYVLGALDASELEEVELRLKREPDLAGRIVAAQGALGVLTADDDPAGPPDGLSVRTCHRIWSSVTADSGGTADQLAPMHPVASANTHWARRSWGIADVLVAGAISLCAAVLFFPAIVNSRYHAQRLGCANHMRELGVGLSTYADLHGGQFPGATAQGPLAFAGVFAPMLMDNGFLANAATLICPGDSARKDSNLAIPSLQLVMQADQRQRPAIQASAGGSYGYHLGTMARDGLHCPSSRASARYALLCDAPVGGRHAAISPNHGGIGQNTLFNDLSVKFIVGDRIGSDQLFYNDLGQVAAGVNPSDSVIGASPTPPLGW